MSIPALPTANYVLVKIEDKRVSQTDELYVSVVSKTQAYKFIQYQSGANTVYVATTYTPSGGTVASVPLSQLVDSIDNTIGFYVEVFAGGVVPFTGGRIYFADQANAVSYSGGAPGGIAPDAPFTFDGPGRQRGVRRQRSAKPVLRPVPAGREEFLLGNLQNQLCTLLNRGITPVAVGATTTLDNLHLRTGSNTANDLIYVDLSKVQRGTTNPIPWTSPPTSAVTSYFEHQLIKGANAPSGDGVYWNTLQGDIFFSKKRIQKFMVNANDIAQPFKIIPPRLTGNRVTSARFIFAAGGKVKAIEFEWESAAGLERTSVAFTFSYGPATPEAHYATLRLFTPYGQPTYSYSSGDLGPTSAFSTNLVGANPASAPTSGMTVTGISFDDPTYVYQASTADPGAITIYSPQAPPTGLNTNVIAFSRFYPVDSSNNPYGQWNAYAAFFHIGDPAHSVPPPTVDGKGYAFAFDDNGGYSSDITAQLPNSQQSAPGVMTLTLTLLPWGSSGD